MNVIAILDILKRFWYIPAGLSILAAILLLAHCADTSQTKAINAAHDAGAADERANSAAIILNRTERANNAAEAVHSNPVVRNAECLQHARNPADCGGQ